MICPHVTKFAYRERFEGNIHDWKDPVNTHTPECRLEINFFTEYILRMKNRVKIFPEMKEVVVELGKNYTLIVISSSTTGSIQEFLARHNFINSFAEIMGNDVHNSKVEKIKMVFEKYKVVADDCVFITDTLGDIREAEKMQIGAIGVTWGFHTAETLLCGNPSQLVNKPNQLPLAVNEHFKEFK